MKTKDEINNAREAYARSQDLEPIPNPRIRAYVRAHIEIAFEEGAKWAKAQEPNAELVAALEGLLASAHPHPVENPAMFAAWTAARAVLAGRGVEGGGCRTAPDRSRWTEEDAEEAKLKY